MNVETPHRDYGGATALLKPNPNPFAAFVLAHLKTQETRRDAGERQRWKLRLIRSLYERGFAAEQVRKLFRVIDWIMDLPVEYEMGFQRELTRFEEEKKMPYVTSIERLALERGKAEGKAELLMRFLVTRYGDSIPSELAGAIRACPDLDRLGRWADLAFETASLAEFQSRLGTLL